MNLPSAFAKAAIKNGEKTALYYGDASFSYGQLWRQTAWVAEHLRKEHNVKPGQRVGLWLKNSPSFVPALFGGMEAGAVVVPINNFLKPDEVNNIMADAGIDLLVTEVSMGEFVPRLQAARGSVKVVFVEDVLAAEEATGFSASEGSGCTWDENDLAVLIYTSGTTGLPKGIMLTHGNLLHNVESCRQVLEAVGTDRIAVLLPMFHSFMLTVGVLLPLLIGGTIILVKSLHPPKNILQEILHRQATILPSVPPFFRTLCHASLPPDLPLRICISGGAPLPGEILREFNEKFSIPLIEGYGLSESSPVASFNPLQGPWKAGSIGLPIPNVEMSVQNDAGELLPAGATGEICVRGGNVMRGYWNQPEETAKVLRGGWLLTGDVGHRDSDGYYYITDRKKDMLLVNGINVYPREIEEVLYRFPGVREAAVIGRPDARRGEQPVAFISAVEGRQLNEREILSFVRDKLADYKVPRRIIFLEKLPRNATGKILKTALRQLPDSESGPSPIATV